MTNKTLIILSPQLNAIQILITQYNMVKELTYIKDIRSINYENEK